MLRVLHVLALLLLVAAFGDARAAAPAGEPVTAGNLLSSERFWPYHVSLVQDWKPGEKDAPLRKGTRGVLIRVETAERARVDFARSGLRDVPIAMTDLVATANRIRRGELAKSAPNFVRAIGLRLLDSSSGTPRVLELDQVARQRGFLCVFADPKAEGFAELARSLAPLRERAGLLTVLFPETAQGDAITAASLKELGWPVPLVLGHLSEAYTRTLLPAKMAPPALLLQTNEGRLLFASSWKPGMIQELTAALDAAFPAATTAGAVD
jgi:hypothetical protein